jgi:hypothetical protein
MCNPSHGTGNKVGVEKVPVLTCFQIDRPSLQPSCKCLRRITRRLHCPNALPGNVAKVQGGGYVVLVPSVKPMAEITLPF